MLHVRIGENDTREGWHACAQAGDPICWIVPKTAEPGDEALFVFNRDKFIGTGVIASEPKGTTFFDRPAYEADVSALREFVRPLPVEDVARLVPEWKWPASHSIARTTPDDDIARKLH